MMATIASSVITVTGVAFSITIVVLSLASSQYSPRVLRNFMKDWQSQMVLGGFLGIFAYCLLVLRTIREDKAVPALAIFGGTVLAFVAMGLLIYFIHHVANSIRASHLIRAIYEEASSTIDAVYPLIGPDEEEVAEDRIQYGGRLRSPGSGYLQSLNLESFADTAAEVKVSMRFRKGIGDFVARGEAIAELSVPVNREAEARLLRSIAIGRARTLEQDVGFGLRELVDVALKGLSPGINDTTTALIALDHLGALLAQLVERKISARPLIRDGEIRVLPKASNYEDYLKQSLDEIRHQAADNPAVLRKIRDCLRPALERASPGRRELIDRYRVEHFKSVAGDP